MEGKRNGAKTAVIVMAICTFTLFPLVMFFLKIPVPQVLSHVLSLGAPVDTTQAQDFDYFGGEHILAIILGLWAAIVVARNKAIAKYFGENIEFIVLGILLLSCVHVTELILETIYNLQTHFGFTLDVTLEHIFWYAGVLSILYALLSLKEPANEVYLGDEPQ